MVGVTGLEPMASWSRTKRSTKLSYTPKNTLSNFDSVAIIHESFWFVNGFFAFFGNYFAFSFK